jgi:beta-lactamase superfamily II metal-dependent hydrolase
VLCLLCSACRGTETQAETTEATDVSASTESTHGGNVSADLPAYTYGGELAGTYDMSAGGMYYAKGSRSEFDPLLNGSPVEDHLGGGEMWVYTDVTGSAGMAQYETDLADAGYSLYARNELNRNLFSTWVSGEQIVTLSYLESREEFSILLEPMRDLPGLEQDNIYEDKNIPCKVILAPTSHTGRENGICLIFQLCDGSFIIVDGGHGIGFYPGEKQGYEETYDDNAEEIYQILYEHAPDKDNIVIAAWFFSHPHWDHIGAVGPFADLYGDTVKVEQFVLNHPNQKTIQQMWDNSDANLLYVTKMQNAFAKFSTPKIIEAHAGQVFYIRNAVIQVLCTWELQTQYKRAYESVDKMNSASLILDISLCGERLIMLGDSGVGSTYYLNKLYGSWLKADMLTVAHHGYQGANPALYNNIDADIVLWPINREDVTELLGNEINKPLANADAIWVTGKSITVIPLPYTGDEDVIVFEAPVLAGKEWEDVYPGISN